MKIRCLSPYTNHARRLEFEPGEYDVSDEVAAFLALDSPGSFTVVKLAKPAPVMTQTPPIYQPLEATEEKQVEPPDVEPEVEPKAFDAPPRDTSLKAAPKTKRPRSAG